MAARRDPHGDAVVQNLQARGCRVLHIDHYTPEAFELRIGRTGAWELQCEGQALPLPAVAWFRFKMMGPGIISSDEDSIARLRVTEWSSFLSGLGLLLGRARLNGRAEAHSKPLQLQLAGKAGFAVPESAFFIGKRAGVAMLQRVGNVVMKPIGDPNTAQFSLQDRPIGPTALVTTRVDSSHFAEAADDEFRAAPTWFQEQVCSGYEHRVIVIGDRVIARRMTIPIEQRAHVDSRVRPAAVERVEVDGRCRAAMSRYLELVGLDYGVFDLIERDGQWIFLECNPEGQWGPVGSEFDQAATAMADLIAFRVGKRDLEPS